MIVRQDLHLVSLTCLLQNPFLGDYINALSLYFLFPIRISSIGISTVFFFFCISYFSIPAIFPPNHYPTFRNTICAVTILVTNSGNKLYALVSLKSLSVNTKASWNYKLVIMHSLFCTMTNKYTIISQIITLLHVSTLSCHPQGACNQNLAKLHEHFKYSCWYYNLQLRCFT